jgi:hypothetical protein
MVAQSYNPSYLRVRDWEDASLRPAGEKVKQDPISPKKKLGLVVHAYYSS